MTTSAGGLMMERVWNLVIYWTLTVFIAFSLGIGAGN